MPNDRLATDAGDGNLLADCSSRLPVQGKLNGAEARHASFAFPGRM